MILYYFPIAQNTVNKTVIDFFQRCICLYMYVHIFDYFSIYWSDTSLGHFQFVQMLLDKIYTVGNYTIYRYYITSYCKIISEAEFCLGQCQLVQMV